MQYKNHLRINKRPVCEKVFNLILYYLQKTYILVILYH